MKTKAYIVNEALEIAAHDDEKVLVGNLINRKRVELSLNAYAIVKRFSKERFTEADFISYFPPTEQGTAEVFFSFLYQNGIVIPEEGAGSIFTFSAYDYGLFHAQKASFESSWKNMIIGLPFDKGNANSLAVNMAPSYLRNICKQLGMNLKNTDESILGKTFALGNYSFAPLINALGTNELVDAGDLYCHTYVLPNIYYDQITGATIDLLQRSNKPFFIGGDHSITLPILKGFASKFESFGVLHIDAHSDTYSHSIDLAFKNVTTHHHGNFVNEALCIDSIKQYHLIGIRGLNTTSFPANDKLHIHFCNEVLNTDDWMQTIDPSLPYYITFDIDVMDHSVAPGTGTPVPGGLPHYKALQMLSQLTRHIHIIGADIVEIDPQRDKESITAQTAVSIIALLLNALCTK